jgi:hypothetical protein
MAQVVGRLMLALVSARMTVSVRPAIGWVMAHETPTTSGMPRG